jgi:hypothetical protein
VWLCGKVGVGRSAPVFLMQALAIIEVYIGSMGGLQFNPQSSGPPDICSRSIHVGK